MGGLVGYNAGTIAAPSPVNAAGWGRARVKDLIAEGDSIVGGLVGTNAAGIWLTGWNMEITTLKNTGRNYLNDSPIAYVGGLAGQNEGVVDSCTAKVGTLTDIANSASKESPFSTYVGGLVGCNQKSGEVKNVKAEVGNLTNSSPIACVGGLMGSNIGSISGESSAKVVELTNSGRIAEVGGLVGRNDSGTIRGVCSAEVNTLTTESAGYVGGLAGKNTGTIAATEVGEQCSATVGTLTNSGNFGNVDSVYVGGLVGYNDRGQVTGCTAAVTELLNEGNAKSAIVAVGGLVGYNYDGLNSEDHTAVIKDCAATVTTLINTKNGKEAYVGGLVGKNDGGRVEESGTEVDTLINRGQYAYVGGLVGYNGINGASGQRRGLVKMCYATVAILTNDINEGSSFSDQNSGARVGGLVGDNCSGQVEDCTAAITGGADKAIALVNKSAGAHVGGLVGHNEKNSASGGAPTATLSNCVASVAGISNEEGYLSYVGGLVGYNGSSAKISEGVATVSLTLENRKDGYVGGLVGCNRDYTSSIQHSWAIVAEFTNSRIGSLIGSNVSLDVKDCTANRDPMVGSGSIDISNQVVPDPDPAGYSGAADAVAAALPPEQPEGVKGRRKKSRREIG